MLKYILAEKAIIISIVVAIITYFVEHSILNIGNSIFIGLTTIILFSLIIYSALSVSHHAEKLAEKFGEPYGTMILTISAIIVEVVIIGIMMWNGHDANLARDTIVAAIILDICGLLGFSALIGGIIHGVQSYNVDSSNSYLAIIFIALFSSMVIPSFFVKEYLPSGIDIEQLTINYEIMLVVLFIIMTGIFYKIQTVDHKGFFQTQNLELEKHPKSAKKINGTYHISMLICTIIMIGILSEFLSVFLTPSLENFGLPIGLGALIVAIISASPEFMTAIKAAKNNKMQTVVNVSFGASVATVLLTVPAMIILAYILGMHINLQLTAIQGILLFGTIFTALITLGDGKLNKLEGFVYLMIFTVFMFLMFNGVM